MRIIKVKAVTNRKLCEKSLELVVDKLVKKSLFVNINENFSQKKQFDCEVLLDSILLREKDLSIQNYFKLLEKISNVCNNKGVKLFVHNFYELLDGKEYKKIHLPYSRFIEFAYNGFYDFKGNLLFDEIGVSVHSELEVLNVEDILKKSEVLKDVNFKRGYVTVGNIFETSCKPNKKGVGIEFLQNIISKVTFLDVFAIGGITMRNISSFENVQGLKGVCMMSDLMKI